MLGVSDSLTPSRRRKTESDDRDELVIPCAVEELDPDDYSSALFCRHERWDAHKKITVNQGPNFFNLGFLCDENGVQISKDRIAAMTKRETA